MLYLHLELDLHKLNTQRENLGRVTDFDFMQVSAADYWKFVDSFVQFFKKMLFHLAQNTT